MRSSAAAGQLSISTWLPFRLIEQRSGFGHSTACSGCPFHVIRAPRPANAIIDFARQNNADLIVLAVSGADEADQSW